MASHFGEMLMNRRRQMGLSIQQVANIIKIRPQIIEYFETGNFSAMPLRGYAQGMISSYARFLGLNPREVMNSYFNELEEYENSTARSGGRLQAAAGDVTTRSASETGRFMMVNTQPRSRFAQRPPQAGYISESVSSHEPVTISDARSRLGTHSPHQSSVPSDRYGSVQRQAASRAGYGQNPGRTVAAPPRSRTTGSRPSGDPRRRSGSRAAGRPAPVRRSGPHGSSGNGRRPPQGRSRVFNNGGRGSRSGSGLDPRIIIAGFVIGLAIIVLLIALLVRSCSPTPQSAPAEDAGSAITEAIDEGAVSASSEASSDISGSDSDDESSSGDSADDKTQTASEVPEEYVVKITVGEGDSSWLEVRVDGETVYGNEVIGPFEQEYTVKDSIRITADTPGSVRVTNNGEAVRWDTSTSGVARINLTVPEQPAEGSSAAEDSATKDESSSDASTDSSADSAA